MADEKGSKRKAAFKVRLGSSSGCDKENYYMKRINFMHACIQAHPKG
jgi:hypothetical protein